MRLNDWFLEPGERGNDATVLDTRHTLARARGLLDPTDGVVRDHP